MKKYLILFLLLIPVICISQTLPSYVPASGLIAWYPFTGNANDSSGNRNNGTVMGATLTTDRFGHPNSAYYFNGSASEISTSLLPPTGNAARTITCWFKYDSLLNPCGDKSLCMVGYGGNTRACSEAGKDFSLQVNYYSNPPAAEIDGICIQTMALDTADTLNKCWHFFAAVYDPSFGDFYNIKIYLDGAYKTTTTNVYGGTSAVNTDTLTRLQIGKGDLECSRYFDGTIDDIGIWNRALSDTELFALYHAIPIAATDSFSVYVNHICNTCSGPQITISPTNYSASLNVQTWFGDGSTETDTFSSSLGYCLFSHGYDFSGVYTIKNVLYDGGVGIDSIQYNYTDVLCNTMPLEFYYDANNDCIKDSGDVVNSQPVLLEIDSNGAAIDTISATSGLYYNAYGVTGDVYGFKVIGTAAGFHVTCPTTAIVYDTLGAASLTTPTQYIGLECNTSTSFDLSVNAVIPVTGVNDEWGDIYIQNNYCELTNGTLTLHFSPKYGGTPNQLYPPATSVSGNTITWDLAALTSTAPAPIMLHYSIWAGDTLLTIADTVMSTVEITPIIGDADTTNNIEIVIDTVKGGCDPNEMWVSPASCIVSGTAANQLQYTINFENTGNDTAHNIYVLDTLSGNVDVSSMRLVMSSYQMYISKLKDAAGDNILKFDFPGINLLDSTYHGQCNGALIFNINTIPGLADGTNIYNRAGIYFDYNNVVMTNQVDNVIGCTTTSVGNVQAVASSPVVYPNPAADVLTIKADNTIFASYTITNSIGTSILTGEISQSETQVNIKALPAGLYFVNMNGGAGNAVRKFVKM